MKLIVGGDSLIGKGLSDYWSNNDVTFHASTRRPEKKSINNPFIDLSRKIQIDNSKYDNAVICASITNIEKCEKDPTGTKLINVFGIKKLINELSRSNTHILFLSSNLVFCGDSPKIKPNAVRNGYTEYGKQKIEIERFIESYKNHCILRLTKVIYPELIIYKYWHKELSQGHSINAFDDLMIAPISLNVVINTIDRLIKNNAIGIHQLSGSQDISYFQFAKDFAKKNGYSRDLVKMDSWEGKLGFEPPKFTSLVNV